MIQTLLHKRKYIFIVLGIAFLLLFYLFSWQVKNERFKQINFNTSVRIQYKVSERMDEVFEDLSFFVSPVMSVFFIGLLTIIAFVDVRKKKIRWRAVFIPLAFGALVGLEIYGKDRVESPAPPHFMIKNPTTIFPRYHVQDQYSYPSGHAGRVLFIGGVTTLLTWRFFYRKFGIIGLAGLVSFIGLPVLLISVGKIYLGHHWLSDIVGGWIVAFAFLSFVLGTYTYDE